MAQPSVEPDALVHAACLAGSDGGALVNVVSIGAQCRAIDGRAQYVTATMFQVSIVAQRATPLLA